MTVFGHATYLIFELGWSIPVIVLGWVLDRKALRARLRLIAFVALVATGYLTLADSVALSSGIWVVHQNGVTGLRLGNVPIEESIFFFASNLMVVQSLILLQPRGAPLRRAAR